MTIVLALMAFFLRGELKVRLEKVTNNVLIDSGHWLNQLIFFFNTSYSNYGYVLKIKSNHKKFFFIDASQEFDKVKTQTL